MKNHFGSKIYVEWSFERHGRATSLYDVLSDVDWIELFTDDWQS
jgi:hypothetical protein